MSHGWMQRALRYGWVLGLVAVLAHLGWELARGGVRSHHLLAQPELPSFSNAWGLLTLPVLGWLASWVVTRRAAGVPGAAGLAVFAFLGALLVGLALSSSFALGFDTATPVIFFAALASGLVFRTYRVECVFGFVLGMLVVFGGVLPVLIATVAASLSALSHFVLWPACAWMWRTLRGVPAR